MPANGGRYLITNADEAGVQQQPGSLPCAEQLYDYLMMMCRCNNARADFAAGIAYAFFTKEKYLRPLVNY